MPARAQSVRGTVVAGSTGNPISGALISLLDADSARVDETLSGNEGSFALTASRAGRYRIRVERIGFATWTTSAFELTAGSSVERHLEVPVRPVSLDGLSVEAERTCRTNMEDAEAAYRLWTETRKALERRQWTRRRRDYRFDIRRRVEVMEVRSRRLVLDSVAERKGVVGRPFVSAPVDSLIEGGWVQPAGNDHIYFGPDAAALLSDTFLESHCFRPVVPESVGDRLAPSDGASDGLVGLAFEPVPGRTVAEIEGVLWVDRESAELRELTFRYVNLPPGIPAGSYGGRVGFRALEDGAWIVDRWTLRVPQVQESRIRVDGRSVSSTGTTEIKTAEARVLAVHRAGSAEERRPGPTMRAAALYLHRVGFFGRRGGSGRYLGPDQLASLSPAAARSHLEKLWARIDSACADGPALWVDGTLVEAVSGAYRIPDGSLVAVEAYTDGASVPDRFRAGEGCGSLVYWTAAGIGDTDES